MKRLTRRNLFAAATAAPLAAVLAQEAPKPTSREDDLKTARDLMASNAAQLAKIDIPMATEPAFVFKA